MAPEPSGPIPVRPQGHPERRIGNTRRENPLEPETEAAFVNYDAEVAHAESLIRMAKECEFADLAAMIERDLVTTLCYALRAIDGEMRAKLAARYRRWLEPKDAS